MSGFIAGALAWMLAEILLTGIMLGLYLVLRKATMAASDRYNFLKLAFLFVAFLPWMPFPWAAFLTNGVTSTPSSVIAATAIKIQPVVASASIYAWLATGVVAAYFVAAFFFVARLLVSLMKLRRLAAASTVAFEHDGVPVYSTDESLPPATFGMIRPVILISRTTLEQVSVPELQMILEHETHHIKRRDYVFNLAKALVQSILVFSPFIHRLARSYVEEMELSCDALVVSRGGHDARDYGGLLLRLTAETRPRMDLVYSGLFASNSFISRRITAMKNVDAKSRKTVWLMALGLLAMVAGPAVTSLGLDSAIGNVIAPAVGPANSFGYQANVVLANDKKESTSGTLKIVDGKRTDIALGNLQMQITPHKVSEGWKFTIETRDSKTDKVVQSASIITSESEGARVESKSDDAAGEDIKAFSLSLAPILHTTSTAEKSAGLIQSGDMVTLNFKDPTDIKDVIKTMAQVSGKNIILSRDIDSKVTVVSDHPIPKKDAYQAFIAALEQVDVVAITEGKAIRLIRKPTAAR